MEIPYGRRIISDLVSLEDKLHNSSKSFGMQISAEKTKIMTNNSNGIHVEIKIDNDKLKSVSKFKYLGTHEVTDEGSKPDIPSRISQTSVALTKLKPILKDKNIALKSKVRLIRSLVHSIFLCARESWTLTTGTE